MLQSRGDRAGRAHPDGWGIAYYVDAQPQVERRAAAAFSDLHFSDTAERVFAATVIAHVRQATIGTNSIYNSHPFQVGRWTFAHNGTVTAIDQLHDELLAEIDAGLHPLRLGETDSELIFLWLFSRLRKANAVTLERYTDLDRLRDVIARSLTELDQRNQRAGEGAAARLNLIMTDGNIMVATRLRNSLSYVERFGIHDCEICGIPHVHDDTLLEDYCAVVVASEPLSSEAWQDIPDGSILTIDEGLHVRVEPLT